MPRQFSVLITVESKHGSVTSHGQYMSSKSACPPGTLSTSLACIADRPLLIHSVSAFCALFRIISIRSSLSCADVSMAPDVSNTNAFYHCNYNLSMFPSIDIKRKRLLMHSYSSQSPRWSCKGYAGFIDRLQLSPKVFELSV